MEMIIGGAYQGKSSYAEKQFPDVKWKCGAELTEEELLDQGIKPNTIRLSIGTEHIDDIIADLEGGFAAVQGK